MISKEHNNYKLSARIQHETMFCFYTISIPWTSNSNDYDGLPIPMMEFDNIWAYIQMDSGDNNL